MEKIAQEEHNIKSRIEKLISYLNIEANGADKNFILFLRYWLMKHIERYYDNENFKINDESLSTSLAGDMTQYDGNIDQIVEKELMIMGNDARDWMVHAMPTVIGCKVTICFLDTIHSSYDEHTYKPATGIEYKELPYLNGLFKKENFHILLKPGHYDILYTHDELKRYTFLDYADDPQGEESKKNEAPLMPQNSKEVSSVSPMYGAYPSVKPMGQSTEKLISNFADKIGSKSFKAISSSNITCPEFYMTVAIILKKNSILFDSPLCNKCNVNIGMISCNIKYCWDCYLKFYNGMPPESAYNSCLHSIKLHKKENICPQCPPESKAPISVQLNILYNISLPNKTKLCMACNENRPLQTVCTFCNRAVCIGCLHYFMYVQNNKISYYCPNCTSITKKFIKANFCLVCDCNLTDTESDPPYDRCKKCKKFTNSYAISLKTPTDPKKGYYKFDTEIRCSLCLSRYDVLSLYDCLHYIYCSKCYFL